MRLTHYTLRMFHARSSFRSVITLSAVLAGVSQVNAATLVGTVNTSPASTINLTSSGSTNWAIWSYPSTNTGATLASSNRKASGPAAGTAGFISAVSPAGAATGVRGGNASSETFSYSDGNSAPTTLAASTIGLVITSTATLDVIGEGVRLTVTGDPTQQYLVSVWATGYDGTGTMTASTPNATSSVLLSQAYTAGTKVPTLFTYVFQPDNIADVLTLNYVLSTNTGLAGAGNNISHVGIQAVTVTVIPEPSSIAAGSLGVALLAFRRRRLQ